MKKIFFRRTLVFVSTIILILIAFIMFSTNTLAEDPPEDPNNGWYVEGSGTYFEINNSTYLNISLTSSETVIVILESVPRIVSYHIQSNCTAQSTLITLSGFIPGLTYYLHQDGNLTETFVADQNGSYSYTQDITTHHHIFIQETASSIYIYSWGVSPSSAPISKVGNEYYLTDDIHETIYVYTSDITIDGQGYSIQKVGGGYDYRGIYINGRDGVTIKNLNIQGWTYGLVIYYCNDITIQDCVIQSNSHSGVYSYKSEICVTGCTISQHYYGLTIRGYNDYKPTCTIDCNIITDSTYGLYVYYCSNVIITSNTIANNPFSGLMLQRTSGSTISGNTITNNGWYDTSYCWGLSFWSQTNLNTVTDNTISNNAIGIYNYGSYSNTFHHNNIINNYYQYRQIGYTHTWDDGAGEGNYWSDYTGVDDGSGGRTPGDGIGDTLIPHPYSNQGYGYYQLDNYPLMNQIIYANNPPIADAGGPYSAGEGTPITLTAKGSSDPDCGNLLEFRWDLDNDGTWDTAYSPDPFYTITWGDDDVGTVMVEVTDGEFVNTDTSTIYVTNVDPDATLSVDLPLPDNFILVTNYNAQSYFVDIFQDGTFSSPAELIDDKDSRCYGAGLGDFDNDGDFDILVGDWFDTWYYEKIGLDNDFAPAVSIDSTFVSYKMDFAEADFNNDGNLDAIQATYSPNLFIYLGNGDGTFTVNTLTSPVYSTSLDAGDFNGDSNMDFILGEQFYGAYMYLGNGDGTFTSSQIVPYTGYSGVGICAGDYDNDGDDDFIYQQYFYPNNGDGTFGSAIHTGITDYPYAIADSDINRDGNLDVVYQGGNWIYCWLGAGDGTFTLRLPNTWMGWWAGYGIAIAQDLIPPLYIYEGDSIPFSGYFSDPGWEDTHDATWDWGDGSPSVIGTLTEENIEPFSTGDIIDSYSYGDNGQFTVTLSVTDDDAGVGTDTFILDILNVAPNITSLSLPLDPVDISNAVALTAQFTDPGILDTHTATIDWGDGNTSTGSISGSGGTYDVSSSWTYGQAGVYTITLTVEDDDGDSDITMFQYVVVYDPSAGFVTGGGWIMSPEGAYTPDSTITGKANFGFVSKYKKGKSTPDGNTEFNFKMADLNFHSTDYEWMVIAGAKAKYKGNGTINNIGTYGFMLSTIDEELTPSTDADLFRIKIWDKDNNDTVIYDNNLGNDDEADPATEIGGGSIVIHSTEKHDPDAETDQDWNIDTFINNIRNNAEELLSNVMQKLALIHLIFGRFLENHPNLIPLLRCILG
jgi:parallel beta-helix repeat protein